MCLTLYFLGKEILLKRFILYRKWLFKGEKFYSFKSWPYLRMETQIKMIEVLHLKIYLVTLIEAVQKASMKIILAVCIGRLCC